MSLDPALLPLLSLQGDLKMRLITRWSMDQGLAHEVAADLAHLVNTSDAIRPEARAAYEALADGDVAS